MQLKALCSSFDVEAAAVKSNLPMSEVLTWEYRIHSDTGLRQLFRHCFRESDDASFRGAVVAHHCNAYLLS